MDPGKRVTHRFFFEGTVGELTEELATTYAAIGLVLDMKLFLDGSRNHQALTRARDRFFSMNRMLHDADPEAFNLAQAILQGENVRKDLR